MTEVVPLKVLLVADTSQTARLMTLDWKENGASVSTCRINAAYAQCKQDGVDAVIYLAAPKAADNTFEPVLKRISRDFRRTLVYVVLPDPDKRLALIADDHIEAIFRDLPPVRDLVAIIRRAAEVRAVQRSRNTPRYPVRYGCIVKVVGTSGIVEGEVRQIGRGGFMASLKDPPFKKTTNDPVRFTIFRKDQTGVTRIEGDGEICWGDTVASETGNVRLGVKFTRLDGPSEGHLLACINSIRTTIGEPAASR